MNHRALAILFVSVALAACSSDADRGSGGGGGGTDVDLAEGGGGAGGGAIDPGASLDLFACGVEPECVQDVGHLGETLRDEDVRCGGELVTSDEGGALLWMSQPGPYATEIEVLVVFAADGTAHQQSRSRCAVEDGCSDQNTTAWSRGPIQRCVVEVDPATVEGCGTEDGSCAWYGQTRDCVDVDEDWTCADLPG